MKKAYPVDVAEEVIAFFYADEPNRGGGGILQEKLQEVLGVTISVHCPECEILETD